MMAGFRLGLKRKKTSAPRMTKPPTMPPAIPPFAPEERPPVSGSGGGVGGRVLVVVEEVLVDVCT